MNSLTPDTIAALQRSGYISAQQARNPALIPQANGQPDYTNPQFQGLHPITPNAGLDRAAAAQAAAAAPDLRYGTNAAGQVNGPPQSPPAAATAEPPKAAPQFAPNPNAPQPGAQAAGAAATSPFAPNYVTIPGREGRAVSPGQEAQFNAAGEQQREANMLSAGAELGANEGESNTLRNISAGMRHQQAQREEAESRGQQALASMNADIAQKRLEADSGQPLNYDRWWQGRSTGGKVMATLAQAFGAFGAAMTHSDNAAAKIIQGHIDRDIAEQQDNLKKKQGALANARSSLGDLRAQLGDERAARDAEELKQVQMWRTAGEAEAKRLNSPVIAAKWAQTDAQLAQQQAELQAKLRPWVQPQTVDTGKLALERAKAEADLGATRAGTAEKIAGAEKTAAETEKLGQGGAAAIAPPPNLSIAHPVDSQRALEDANTRNRALLFQKYGKRGQALADSLQYGVGLPGRNEQIHRTLTAVLGGVGAPQGPAITPETAEE